jgi:hypothetical protein
MKIWFDLSNSPHINMFYDLIKDLEKDGHEVIITCRPLANTVDLLEQRKLRFTIVGEHYGKNFLKKIFGYPIRVYQLVKFLRNKQINVAVSQSSFHSPVVAKLLGVPSIYTNDNEHAMGNTPAFIFATKILIPENLEVEKVVSKGASRKKIVQYPGLKESFYLWRKGKIIHEARTFNAADKTIRIYVRPEPLTAQYYKGGLNFMDDLLAELAKYYEVTVLPRDKTQLQHFKAEKFSNMKVAEKPIMFDEIAEKCSLFIGAGGSMTRELAILGIPTISVYQDELLDVDTYLIEKGMMMHMKTPGLSDIQRVLAEDGSSEPNLSLMEKGEEAYQLFKSEIYKLIKK